VKCSHLTVLSLVFAIICGCTAPSDTPERRTGAAASRQDHSRRGSASEAVRAASADDPDATGPVSRLVINGETTYADQILRNPYDDLLEKSRTLPPDQYSQYRLRVAASAVRDKIAEVLLHQKSSARLSSEEQTAIGKMADDEIRRMVNTRYGGVQRRFEKELETKGQTLDDVWTSISRQIVVGRYLEMNLKPKVPEPTRDELLAMFNANLDEWRRPARSSMSLIDVRVRRCLPEGTTHPTPEQLVAARTIARERIEQARDSLRETPFSDVAREFSDGLHADEGGVWGWVTIDGVRERFTPAVEALYTLKAQQVSDIIETDESFFIVRCDENDPGAEPDFQVVQTELRNRSFQEAYNRLIEEKVVDLQDRADIQPANLDRFLLAVLQTAPLPGGIEPSP